MNGMLQHRPLVVLNKHPAIVGVIVVGVANPEKQRTIKIQRLLNKSANFILPLVIVCLLNKKYRDTNCVFISFHFTLRMGMGTALDALILFAEVWWRSSASSSHSPFWRECGHLRDDYFSQIWFVSNKVIRKNYKYLMISPANDEHEKPLQATHCGRPTKTKADLSPRRKKRYIFVNIFTLYKRNPVPQTIRVWYPLHHAGNTTIEDVIYEAWNVVSLGIFFLQQYCSVSSTVLRKHRNRLPIYLTNRFHAAVRPFSNRS